jgi:hypothetical protein
MKSTTLIFASEANQSRVEIDRPGLLRFARDDEVGLNKDAMPLLSMSGLH